ncbi:MAG: TolC family protein [Bacteroidota bacterium]
MTNKLLAFIFLSGSLTLSAQQTLNLETCLKMADTANLSIRNARLDVELNQKQIKAYKSAITPKVTFTGDYKYNAIIPGQVVPAAFFGGAPGTYATVQFGVPYNFGNTLQLTQVIYNPQVNYALQALALNQKVIEIQETMTEQDTKHQVASTYFNLQAMAKQLAFLKDNLANMDKLILNMEKTVKAELVVETELDKLKINRLNVVNSQQTLEATKEQMETLLKILIGIKSDQTITLDSDQMMQNSILVDSEQIKHSEIDLLDAQLNLNAEERKGTNMAYLPSLSFYAAYNYTYNMKPEDDFRTGIESAFIGLRLDWTLFDGLEKYNKQKVNAINREKIENQKNLVSQQLQLATDNAKKQIAIQANSLTISKEQLFLAERVYKQTQAQFTEGTVSSNDLITSENSLHQAQTNVVSAYIQLRQAELAYLKSIGNIK